MAAKLLSSTVMSHFLSSPDFSHENPFGGVSFELLDHLGFEEGWMEESASTQFDCLQIPTWSPEIVENSNQSFLPSGGNSNMGPENSRKKTNNCDRVAFRTRSPVEIMDDGFKWRKYGKKSVKNSPNPRNYYKCANGRCTVKKKVERDRDDPSFVITTYEGVHNHMSPMHCRF